MEMKIDKRFIYKVLVLFLCVYLALMPAFSYKKVDAAFEKGKAYIGLITTIVCGLQSVGFISKTALTPENLTNIYNKADEYLHQNFGTELEYAEALRQVDQLGLDIASGQIFVPGNYSGKLWYSFLNAVKDVLYPTQAEPTIDSGYSVYCYLPDGSYVIYKLYSDYGNTLSRHTLVNPTLLSFTNAYNIQFGVFADYFEGLSPDIYYRNMSVNFSLQLKDYSGSQMAVLGGGAFGQGSVDCDMQLSKDSVWIKIFFGGLNSYYVRDITAKTANKVKLPTRLPQTVINNINNYIDGSSENLIVNPTPDELPTLPDNYNPATDDPPDLPGYEDVTPDQEPTPTPTPEPTPEPTPTPPDYDGSSWIKPIGDFFAGLLSFLKDALIPTQTVDVTPLQNMGTDVSGKFPFSLPGDIGKLFGVLNAEPIRPHFEMDFDLSKVGIPGEPIHWDLNVEQWDNGAAVVKTALYIAFLIGLVFITKQFMQN